MKKHQNQNDFFDSSSSNSEAPKANQDNNNLPLQFGHAFQTHSLENQKQSDQKDGRAQQQQCNIPNFLNYLQIANQNSQQISTPPYYEPSPPLYNYEGNFHNFMNNSSTCSTEMITSLYEIVQKQTEALQKLNKKVEDQIEKNKEYKKQIRQLRQEKKKWGSQSELKIHKQQRKSVVKKENSYEQLGQDSEIVSILFGVKQYNYSLRLMEDFSLPLYRQRNFNIKIELVDSSGIRVTNSNVIPMSLAIYTCQSPPKFIDKNTSGQKMLKGYIDQSLINGVCHFEKVQIREVTSHYRNGWVYCIVIPCMSPLGTVKNQSYVDFLKIRPLVIPEVIVKAKKPKKKEHESKEDLNNSHQVCKKKKKIESGSEEWSD